MIFTEKTFVSLKKEISKFNSNESKLKINHVKQVPKFKNKPIPCRTIGDYEPSNVWTAYDGARQRWRRMNDWFNRSTLDERQDALSKNIIKQLEE